MRTTSLISFSLALAGFLSAQSKPAPIYKITDPGIKRPQSISTPMAPYPKEARKAKIQGVVVIDGYVGADGGFHDAKVVHSANTILDAQALETVGTWKFRPCTKDGTPVNCHMNVEMNFHLY